MSKGGRKETKNLNNAQVVHQAIIDITDMADYNLNYNNPSDVLKGRGNCQAYSLFFREIMIKHKIENRIILTDDYSHMYNNLKLENEWLDIDMTAFEGLYK